MAKTNHIPEKMVEYKERPRIDIESQLALFESAGIKFKVSKRFLKYLLRDNGVVFGKEYTYKTALSRGNLGGLPCVSYAACWRMDVILL